MVGAVGAFSFCASKFTVVDGLANIDTLFIKVYILPAQPQLFAGTQASVKRKDIKVSGYRIADGRDNCFALFWVMWGYSVESCPNSLGRAASDNV